MMLLVSFIFVLFVGRLAYIMLGGEVDGVDLRASAQQQYGRSSIQLAKRGTIYDVGGNAIATDATSYNLYAVLTSAWADEGAEPIHVPD
ncbi:penicillin-binding protein, partial [Streptococcus anginosus]|nr:penicillin-binding protein [Streptococcus anginosus]